MNRARTTQPETATELGAGHAQDIARHPEHRRVVVDIDAMCLPVDSDGEGHDVLSFAKNDTKNTDGIKPEALRPIHGTMVSVDTLVSVGRRRALGSRCIDKLVL